jgi:hypothetical protein
MFTIRNIIISIIPSIIYFIECPRMSLREYLPPRVSSFRLYWTILLFWLVSDDLKYLLEHHISFINFLNISLMVKWGSFQSPLPTNNFAQRTNLSISLLVEISIMSFCTTHSPPNLSSSFHSCWWDCMALLSWSHVVQVYWLEVVQV